MRAVKYVNNFFLLKIQEDLGGSSGQVQALGPHEVPEAGPLQSRWMLCLFLVAVCRVGWCEIATLKTIFLGYVLKVAYEMMELIGL